MDKVLDVRAMTPKDRHPSILAAYDGLKPGESFTLVNDHEPRPLLYQFQNEKDGDFEWWPLESGPAAWRVSIEKRRVPGRDRDVTDYLQADHRRLDAIYERFQVAYKSGAWDDAVARFAEFSLGLRRHIRIEEEILFPAFEEKTGMKDAGPTFVMRMEHTEIKRFLDAITSAAAAKDAAKAKDETYHLTNVLADHNMKEEHILYPESDAFLSPEERTAVVKKAQLL